MSPWFVPGGADTRSMVSRRHLLLLTAVALCALPGFARAQRESVTDPAWATINSCAPRAVGVRAQLSGDEREGDLFARFKLEWYSSLVGRWLPVEGEARSPWLRAGSAREAFGQVGWTFDVEGPPSGTTFRLRGLARLQWRRAGEVAREETRVTSEGLAGVDEGRPPGTSLAECSLG
jgi:hypothetical protein